MHVRRIAKAIIPVSMALIVGISLWLSSPQRVEALNIQFPSLPSSVTVGQTYNFSVKIDIQDGDVLPLFGADLYILNSSNSVVVTCSGLPLTSTTRNYSETETGAGTVTIVAGTSGSWDYGFDNRTGYWNGSPQQFGYGYGYGLAGASISYTITWTTPASLTPGNYHVNVKINGNDSISRDSGAFTIAQQASGGGGGGIGGGGGGGPSGPGITNLGIYTNDSGVFVLEGIAYSFDNLASIYFPRGTKALQKDGTRLRSITITPMDPAMPAPAGSVMFGVPYDFSPEGATFTSPVTLTISYDPEDIPEGFNPANIVVHLWDAGEKKWVPQEGAIVDTVKHTVSIQVSHLSSYALIGTIKPASFVVKNVAISSSEITVGSAVTITASVANQGDLSGECAVILKVNGKEETTQRVTLSGNTNRDVNFSITPASAGTYEIDVNGKLVVLSVVKPTSPGALTLKSLAVFPSEVTYGDEAIISVIAENNGDEPCTDTVVFKIDDTVVYTEAVTLLPHSSKTIEFSTSNSQPGVRAVDINGQKASFVVKPLIEPKTTGVINWYLIGGIIFIVTAVASITGFRLRERSRYNPPTPRRKN